MTRLFKFLAFFSKLIMLCTMPQTTTWKRPDHTCNVSLWLFLHYVSLLSYNYPINCFIYNNQNVIHILLA